MNIKTITIAAVIASIGLVVVEESTKELIQRHKEKNSLTRKQRIVDVVKFMVSEIEEGADAKLDIDTILEIAGITDMCIAEQGAVFIPLASYCREYSNYDVHISKDLKSLNFKYIGE